MAQTPLLSRRGNLLADTSSSGLLGQAPYVAKPNVIDILSLDSIFGATNSYRSPFFVFGKRQSQKRTTRLFVPSLTPAQITHFKELISRREWHAACYTQAIV